MPPHRRRGPWDTVAIVAFDKENLEAEECKYFHCRAWRGEVLHEEMMVEGLRFGFNNGSTTTAATSIGWRKFSPRRGIPPDQPYGHIILER